MEQALKGKGKQESDNAKLTEQVSGLSANVEALTQANAALDKQRKQLEDSNACTSCSFHSSFSSFKLACVSTAANSKLNDLTKSETALRAAKTKLESENAELAKQLSAAEAKATTLTRSLQAQTVCEGKNCS